MTSNHNNPAQHSYAQKYTNRALFKENPNARTKYQEKPRLGLGQRDADFEYYNYEPLGSRIPHQYDVYDQKYQQVRKDHIQPQSPTFEGDGFNYDYYLEDSIKRNVQERFGMPQERGLNFYEQQQLPPPPNKYSRGVYLNIPNQGYNEQPIYGRSMTPTSYNRNQSRDISPSGTPKGRIIGIQSFTRDRTPERNFVKENYDRIPESPPKEVEIIPDYQAEFFNKPFFNDMNRLVPRPVENDYQVEFSNEDNFQNKAKNMRLVDNKYNGYQQETFDRSPKTHHLQEHQALQDNNLPKFGGHAHKPSLCLSDSEFKISARNVTENDSGFVDAGLAKLIAEEKLAAVPIRHQVDKKLVEKSLRDLPNDKRKTNEVQAPKPNYDRIIKEFLEDEVIPNYQNTNSSFEKNKVLADFLGYEEAEKINVRPSKSPKSSLKKAQILDMVNKMNDSISVDDLAKLIDFVQKGGSASNFPIENLNYGRKEIHQNSSKKPVPTEFSRDFSKNNFDNRIPRQQDNISQYEKFDNEDQYKRGRSISPNTGRAIEKKNDSFMENVNFSEYKDPSISHAENNPYLQPQPEKFYQQPHDVKRFEDGSIYSNMRKNNPSKYERLSKVEPENFQRISTSEIEEDFKRVPRTPNKFERDNLTEPDEPAYDASNRINFENRSQTPKQEKSKHFFKTEAEEELIKVGQRIAEEEYQRSKYNYPHVDTIRNTIPRNDKSLVKEEQSEQWRNTVQNNSKQYDEQQITERMKRLEKFDQKIQEIRSNKNNFTIEPVEYENTSSSPAFGNQRENSYQKSQINYGNKIQVAKEIYTKAVGNNLKEAQAILEKPEKQDRHDKYQEGKRDESKPVEVAKIKFAREHPGSPHTPTSRRDEIFRQIEQEKQRIVEGIYNDERKNDPDNSQKKNGQSILSDFIINELPIPVPKGISTPKYKNNGYEL